MFLIIYLYVAQYLNFLFFFFFFFSVDDSDIDKNHRGGGGDVERYDAEKFLTIYNHRKKIV